MVKLLEKIPLFEARQGGYWNYRVPGVICTTNGTALAHVEARQGVGSDWDDSDILLRRSPDGGRTWGAPSVIVHGRDYGPGPVHNFILIADERPEQPIVHALFCHDYARAFAMTSRDDGQTFSTPVEITAAFETLRGEYAWQVIAAGPGHGLRLRNGRLVVSVWMSDGGGHEYGSGRRGHHPSVTASIFSDDGGQSWQAGEIIARPDEDIHDPSEACLVELEDGRVLCNMRSSSPNNRRLIAISPDGAHDWCAPQFDQALLEPVCMASLLKLRRAAIHGAAATLFVNPHNLENDLISPFVRPIRDRKLLTVQASLDDCQTWTFARLLEPGPAGYSDLAETPTGQVLCIYECGMLHSMYDPASITLARFDIAWLQSL